MNETTITKLSELIKHGYLKEVKKGYVLKRNFNLMDISGELDKSLIIPKNCSFDLTGKSDSDNEGEVFIYSGKGYLFIPERE